MFQDRPVFGGNASSGCRVPAHGAARRGEIPHLREIGIFEELRLENLHRNPHEVYSIQDTIFYEAVRSEPNVTLLLNCVCQEARRDGNHILSVAGYQLTTETHHAVEATIFADCPGAGVLAPLTGAKIRLGREGRDEFGESIAPPEPDRRTMGMTLYFFSSKYDAPQAFDPPEWAYRFESCDDLPWGEEGRSNFRYGYWWVELGGEHDSIHDAEMLRDELLKIAYGVWDHLKNHCSHEDKVANYALDWMGFLPGKRESRRYAGDYIQTQPDIDSEGLGDIVAYGAWTMDDHPRAGFWSVKTPEPATIWHECPSPYGIPYRVLYSENIDNLMFAGPNASFSHAAMSSSRLMGTCVVMGQAVGTAVAIATREGILPRDVNKHIPELQQTLLRDDCYPPWVAQEHGPLTVESRILANQGNPEPVRDGVSRQVNDDPHAWIAHPGDMVAYVFPEAAHVHTVSLALDSDLDKAIYYTSDEYTHQPRRLLPQPPMMPSMFHIDGLTDGEWHTLETITGNYQRFIRVTLDRRLEGVRFVLDETWGGEESRVYSFYVD